MEDLSIHRSLERIGASGVGAAGNPFASRVSTSYEPVLYSSPAIFSTGILNSRNTPELSTSFDSSNYFNTFWLPAAAIPETSFSSFMMPMFTLPSLFMPTFSFPTFSFPKLSFSKKSDKTYKIDTSVKFQSLKDAGYNKKLAKKLAQDAAANAESRSTGYCARYVSNTLARFGIAGKRGDAWQLRDSLRNNSHFKEIDINSIDVSKLPAGCILVYQRGAAGYSSKYGHVEITLGNGKAASDFINSNIKKSSNMSVFVPVSA